jgi:hypothetical protein
MIRSFPPHPNPLPPGEREAIHPPSKQSWMVFWHILIKIKLVLPKSPVVDFRKKS